MQEYFEIHVAGKVAEKTFSENFATSYVRAYNSVMGEELAVVVRRTIADPASEQSQ